MRTTIAVTAMLLAASSHSQNEAMSALTESRAKAIAAAHANRYEVEQVFRIVPATVDGDWITLYTPEDFEVVVRTTNRWQLVAHQRSGRPAEVSMDASGADIRISLGPHQPNAMFPIFRSGEGVRALIY